MEAHSPIAKLHSPSAITLSTTIGMPIAGTILLAQNFRAIGNPRAARQCLVWGVTTTLILMGVAFFLDIPSLILPITYSIAMHNLGNKLQGRRYRSHIESGGKKASLWFAVGIGVVCLFVVWCILYMIVLLGPE